MGDVQALIQMLPWALYALVIWLVDRRAKRISVVKLEQQVMPRLTMLAQEIADLDDSLARHKKMESGLASAEARKQRQAEPQQEVGPDGQPVATPDDLSDGQLLQLFRSRENAFGGNGS